MKKLISGVSVLTVILMMFAVTPQADARMIFSTEEGSTNADAYTIDYDDSAGTGDVVLRFGNTVDETISYDNNTLNFKFSDDVSLEGNSLTNFRIENNSGAVAVCNASNYGQMYFDTSDDGTYVCTSHGWENLEDLGGFVPGDFLSSKESDSYTGTGTLSFGSGTTLSLDANASLDTTSGTVNMDGINNDTLTLDEDGGATDVTLQFGSTIAETIMWDASASRFDISDDLYVNGDLTITGTFSGDLATNTVETADLQDYSVTSVKIATGAVTVNEIGTNAVGSDEIIDNSITATDIALNAVTASELADNSVDTASIQDYAITADKIATGAITVDLIADDSITADKIATGAVTTVEILDATILNEDINANADIDFSKMATRNKSTLISPEYPNFTLYGDTTNNLGTLDADRDTVNNKNYYSWTSRKTVLNDYDIMVQFQIPEDFDSWQANAISFDYMTEEAGTTDNAVQVYILDTTATSTHTTGSLSSATWATENVTSANLSGGTFTAGDNMTVGIKLLSRRNGGSAFGDPRSAFAGDLQFNYVGR